MVACAGGVDDLPDPTLARSPRPDVHLRPAAVLVILGTVIAVLGLFVAGNIAVTIVGLVAVFAAGLLGVAEERLTR